jgi:Holliday junction resolvasome RuvABC endonuclease subunit
MSLFATPPPRILAIDPMSRGFGYAVLEGPTRLVDWGIRNAPNDNSRALLRKIHNLISLYRPDVIVIEDCRHVRSRRRQRVRAVITQVAALATRGTEVQLIPAALVQSVFGAGRAVTKHQIATLVAEHFPELQHRLPPVRKPWMPEDARFAIFDAVAFGLTHFLLDDSETLAGRKRFQGAA